MAKDPKHAQVKVKIVRRCEQCDIGIWLDKSEADAHNGVYHPRFTQAVGNHCLDCHNELKGDGYDKPI